MLSLQFGKGIREIKIPEIILLIAMLPLLFVVLISMWQMDIWRLDSMYYVGGYEDKLVGEGRWINYIFFSYLKLFPSSLALFASVFSIAAFCYAIVRRIGFSRYYCIAFSIMCALVPVLYVQLQWPVTLLVGYLLLAASPWIEKILKDFYFFPVMGVLFFGTFSAFYFLMPLLFLNVEKGRMFIRVMVLWVVGFIVGYLIANGIVYLYSGAGIQLASWRNPNPIQNIDDLVTNTLKVIDSMKHHVNDIDKYMDKKFFLALSLFSGLVAIFKRQYFLPLIAISSALAIYISAIPSGIIISSRTTLISYIALLAMIFFVSYKSRSAQFIAMIIMFFISTKMASASKQGIDWYVSMNNVLKQQLVTTLHPAEEVVKLYIAADFKEYRNVMSRAEKNLSANNYFSEGFGHPHTIIPILKTLKYNEIRVCSNTEGWQCDVIAESYAQRETLKTDKGLFVFKKLNTGEGVLMLNPNSTNY